MRRKKWTREDLVAFLKLQGKTPQVASRITNEVQQDAYYTLALGYKELSEMDLYNEEERGIYARVAEELMRAARR